jgi:integrase
VTAQGSVTKYQAKPGKRGLRWRWRLDAATTGQRPRIGEGGFGTKAAAEAGLAEARRQYAVVIDPTDATLGGHLDSWLEHRVTVGTIRSTTGDQYSDSLKLLGDDLRSVPLRNLTAAHLDRRYAKLMAPREKGRRRSARTIRLFYSVLHVALADAVRKGTIPTNVADASDPPAASQAVAKERRVWSAEHGLAFLRWEGLDLPHRAAWSLVMFGGLRRAEACGLRWSDIVDGELHVCRTRARGRYNEVIIGEPKTASGRRSIPLPGPALDVLAEWRRYHAEMMLAIGERTDEVLVSERGESWHPDRLSQAWKRDVKRAAAAGIVPHVMTLHDGRHWYGSHLVSVGTDLRTVADLMGHADPSFTLRTYAHSDPERKRAAAAALAQLG